MFFNFSHNSAGKEEEEKDPHMKNFTPYSKYSFTSLTRNKYIFFIVYQSFNNSIFYIFYLVRNNFCYNTIAKNVN